MRSTKKIHSKNINPPDIMTHEHFSFKDYVLCLQSGNEKLNTAATLKTLLPSGFEIVVSNNGKPYSSCGIEFNSSSTENASVLIVSKTNPVGIDVECIKKSADAGLIAKDYFSKNEIDILEKNFFNPESFLTFWTRREAFLKMVGTGLIDEMKHLDFSDCVCEIPEKFENVTDLKFSNYFVNTFKHGNEFIISYCTMEDTEVIDFLNHTIFNLTLNY